jgi:hypothetical protein
MNVQLYCIPGCPSCGQALENLRHALARENVRAPVEVVEVVSARDAEATRFPGSPTIRIDGIDIEAPEADSREPAFGCRIYFDGGSSTGWPSVDQIRRALRRGAAR